MTERLDNFLTRKARPLWPDALVFVKADGTFVLRVPGRSDLALGADDTPAAKRFHAAREALSQLCSRERAERSKAS